MRLMKILMAVVLMGITASNVYAQSDKELAKQAKKEAKQLKKEGWKVPVGGLPMEQQLLKSYKMQAETDMEQQPKYIFGQAMSGGTFYDAAKMQATELAKAELAGNISTNLTTLVTTKMENRQTGPQEATSVSEIVQKGKSLVSQKLTLPITLVEIYRDRKEGGMEVQIRLAYDREKVMQAANDAVDSLIK